MSATRDWWCSLRDSACPDSSSGYPCVTHPGALLGLDCGFTEMFPIFLVLYALYLVSSVVVCFKSLCTNRLLLARAFLLPAELLFRDALDVVEAEDPSHVLAGEPGRLPCGSGERHGDDVSIILYVSHLFPPCFQCASCDGRCRLGFSNLSDTSRRVLFRWDHASALQRLHYSVLVCRRLPRLDKLPSSCVLCSATEVVWTLLPYGMPKQKKELCFALAFPATCQTLISLISLI